MGKAGRPNKKIGSMKKKNNWNHKKKITTRIQKFQIASAKKIRSLKEKLECEKEKCNRKNELYVETKNELNIMIESINKQDDIDADSESYDDEDYSIETSKKKTNIEYQNNSRIVSVEKQLLFVFNAYVECNNGIDSIHTHLKFLRDVWNVETACDLWSPTTIRNYIRVRLPILTQCLLGLQFVVNGPTKVTLSFDDTTKQKKMFQHIMLSYSNTTQPSTNPISTSIAYMKSYCKANDGLYEAIAKSINRLNDYI